jgi:hypothetical protein
MNLSNFEASLNHKQPPSELTAPLKALWLAAKGHWEQAHALVQDDESREAAWVHAYLHRVEGDPSNASYWYARARQPVFEGDHEGEWRLIVETQLG